MKGEIETQVGEVLILATEQSFTTYAVGSVCKNGQQDFRGRTNVTYVSDRAAALTEAKALLVRGRRIVFRNIDTGEWRVIPE